MVWSRFSSQRTAGDGTSRRRKGGQEKKRHSKMKGQQKKRGNYCSFLMEMVMKWDMGLGTMGGHRQVECHSANCFLLGSHLASLLLANNLQANYKEVPHQSWRPKLSASPQRLFPGLGLTGARDDLRLQHRSTAVQFSSKPELVVRFLEDWLQASSPAHLSGPQLAAAAGQGISPHVTRKHEEMYNKHS